MYHVVAVSPTAQWMTSDQQRVISTALLHASVKHCLISITGLDETGPQAQLFTAQIKVQSAGRTLLAAAINIIVFQTGQDHRERAAINQSNEQRSD